MTQTTKEVFEKYQVRKSRKQRTAFIEYVKSICDKYDYEVKVESGSFGAKNIVVGNVDKAKVIYTAHYDTCARLFFPNFITPENFLIYILYQILIVSGLVAISIVIGFLLSLILTMCNTGEDFTISFSTNIALAVYWVLLLLMIFGPANKHTANDNTSGVTTLLDIMTALSASEKEKVAFVFFDLEEAGLIGSSSFASKHKEIKKNKPVINFDCVSDGKTILFALKKSTRKYKDLLTSAFKSTDTITVDVAEKGVFYPSDNASFKGGIGVAALKTHKPTKTLYMNRIHTNREPLMTKKTLSFSKMVR